MPSTIVYVHLLFAQTLWSYNGHKTVLQIQTYFSFPRCLPATHRSLGIGVQWIFLRLLGNSPFVYISFHLSVFLSMSTYLYLENYLLSRLSIYLYQINMTKIMLLTTKDLFSGTVPGPLAFGSAFDLACQVWSLDEFGNREQCLFYNKQTMSLLIFAICVGIKLASLLFIILAWKLYKPPKTVREVMDVNGKLPSVGESEGVVNRAFEPAGGNSPCQPSTRLPLSNNTRL